MIQQVGASGYKKEVSLSASICLLSLFCCLEQIQNYIQYFFVLVITFYARSVNLTTYHSPQYVISGWPFILAKYL